MVCLAANARFEEIEGAQKPPTRRFLVSGKGCCFLVFVPTIREIRDFYREMQRTNRESITMYSI
eukprot:SAG31_NODE_1240_length_9167_cov_4.729599_10_plen_64_part_00